MPDVVRWTFVVDPARAAPKTLGVTTVGELLSRRSSGSVPLRFYVRVRLELSDEARDARMLYERQRLIDGAGQGEWRALDDADEVVGVQCPGGVRWVDGIDPGSHDFAHHASRYGEAPSLATDAVATRIACVNAVRVHPTTEVPLTPAEIEEMDRVPDAGFDAGVDAGASGIDAGRDGGVVPGMGCGGCGCRAGGRRPYSSWLALAFVLFRTRRRSS